MKSLRELINLVENRHLKEARDYEDEDLPADERWLRKYLHQGLDR